MGKYVGREVVIIDNISGHDFEIGAVVTLERIFEEGGEQEHWYAVRPDGECWYVASGDFELVEEEV